MDVIILILLVKWVCDSFEFSEDEDVVDVVFLVSDIEINGLVV